MAIEMRVIRRLVLVSALLNMSEDCQRAGGFLMWTGRRGVDHGCARVVIWMHALIDHHLR